MSRKWRDTTKVRRSGEPESYSFGPFSTPNFCARPLELYSDYLLSAFFRATATDLSAMTGGEVSHDKVSRFLSEKDLDSRTLWRLVKPVVRELENLLERSLWSVYLPGVRS